MAEETITLPKSGVVLPKINSCNWGMSAIGVRIQFGTDPGGYYATSGNHYVNFDGDRDAALAWLDARVLELRAALLPPGAIVVSDTEETVERVARAIHAENVAACDGVTEWEDACESVRQFTMCQARAVLAALRESRP